MSLITIITILGILITTLVQKLSDKYKHHPGNSGNAFATACLAYGGTAGLEHQAEDSRYWKRVLYANRTNVFPTCFEEPPSQRRAHRTKAISYCVVPMFAQFFTTASFQLSI